MREGRFFLRIYLGLILRDPWANSLFLCLIIVRQMPKQSSGSYITGFDSTSSMLKSLGHCLHDKRESAGDFPQMPYCFGDWADALPEALRKTLYRWSGVVVATQQNEHYRVQSEDISKLAIEQYPSKAYPAVMLGSSNGALTHLCAAMGIPWLPQTFLLSVKRPMGPDELIQ